MSGELGAIQEIAKKYLVFLRAGSNWIDPCNGSQAIYRKYEEELKERVMKLSDN